jgi:hypothetical protein
VQTLSSQTGQVLQQLVESARKVCAYALLYLLQHAELAQPGELQWHSATQATRAAIARTVDRWNQCAPVSLLPPASPCASSLLLCPGRCLRSHTTASQALCTVVDAAAANSGYVCRSFYRINAAALRGVREWDASTGEYKQPVTVANEHGSLVTSWQELALNGRVQSVWAFVAEPEPEGIDLQVCFHL